MLHVVCRVSCVVFNGWLLLLCVIWFVLLCCEVFHSNVLSVCCVLYVFVCDVSLCVSFCVCD